MSNENDLGGLWRQGYELQQRAPEQIKEVIEALKLTNAQIVEFLEGCSEATLEEYFAALKNSLKALPTPELRLEAMEVISKAFDDLVDASL